jgi:hypothetical protein
METKNKLSFFLIGAFLTITCCEASEDPQPSWWQRQVSGPAYNWFKKRVLRPWQEQKVIERIYGTPIYQNLALTDEYAGLSDLPAVSKMEATERYANKYGRCRKTGIRFSPYSFPMCWTRASGSNILDPVMAEDVSWDVKVDPQLGYRVQPFLGGNPIGKERRLYEDEVERLYEAQRRFGQSGFPRTWKSRKQ